MPDLTPFHPWIVFVHVLGVFAFLIAHGISVGVLFRLRRVATDPQQVRTLLDLSAASFGAMGVAFLVWFFAGVAAGFSGRYWVDNPGQIWIWPALIITIVVVGLMTPFGRFYLDRVRRAVGIDPKTNTLDPAFTVDVAALESAVRSGNPWLLVAIGYGGVAILAWLMMFKPF